MIQFKIELIPKESNVDLKYFFMRTYLFRALLMGRLNLIAPAIVDELHKGNKIRPYIIKVLSTQDKIIYYIHFFDLEIANHFYQDLIKNKVKEYILSDKTFLIRKVVVKNISIKKIFRSALNVKRFQLIFKSPTYFNTMINEFVIRLPIPQYIFNNLCNIVGQLTNIESLPERKEFIDWVIKNIYIKTVSLRTTYRIMKENSRKYGFVGEAVFEILHNHDNYAKFIDFLCKFGELSNVGTARTAGLGVIKYEAIKYFQEADELS
ncbi:MAG: CRISPR system precrRNA processing endoribonuclease RAMP protein Cas6 [Promethearchaeota archaeon]